MRARILAVMVVASMIARPMAMNAQATSSYNDNALRVESHFGDARLVRGEQGILVGKLGNFRVIDLASIVKSSPNAVVEAKKFQKDYLPGAMFAGLGLAAFGAYLGVSRIPDVNGLITYGLWMGGLTLIVYGGGRMHNAYNALSRSIWWYNHDLAK
ncbi:MAG: hypothetical protein ABR585_08340 [Gemmatimonadaceae bacterium]